MFTFKVRGVKILPEFDAPAHVGNGWQFTQNSLDWGKIILCMEKENWMKHCAEPPCGQVKRILQCSDLSRAFFADKENRPVPFYDFTLFVALSLFTGGWFSQHRQKIFCLSWGNESGNKYRKMG